MGKGLPVDVVVDILSRMPVKDLMRFRCVSKNWLRLLSIDPYLCKLHFERQQTQAQNNNAIHNYVGIAVLSLEKPQLCYAYDYTACDNAIKFDIPFADQFPTKHCLVYGTCNGLICLSISVRDEFRNVYLWNPFLRDHITIPCPPLPSGPSLSTVFGFGFHKTADNEYEYKVVRIAWTPNTLESERESHVSVFTLGTSSWRSVESVAYDISLKNYPCAPLVNGALHWISSRPPNSIVSFDLENEVFQEVPAPIVVRHRTTSVVKVVELGGLLCLSLLVVGRFHIWSMEEYGLVDSWTKRFDVRPGSFTYLQPVCLASNISVVIMKNLSKLILLESSSPLPKFCPMLFTSLAVFETEFYSIFTYKGSLVSPKSYQLSQLDESGAKRKRADDSDEEHV